MASRNDILTAFITLLQVNTTGDIEANELLVEMSKIINDYRHQDDSIEVSDITDLDSYVSTQLASLIDSAPSTLDTLNEIATALGDDPNFATTITTLLGAKAPLDSPTLTGSPTSPNVTSSDSSTKIANTAFVADAIIALTNTNPVGWWRFYGFLDADGGSIYYPDYSGSISTSIYVPKYGHILKLDEAGVFGGLTLSVGDIIVYVEAPETADHWELISRDGRSPISQTITSSSTVTLTSAIDVMNVNAQSGAILLTVSNDGAWKNNQSFAVYIRPTATASITFSANFKAIGVTLPTTLASNKEVYIAGFYKFNESTGVAKWHIIGINIEA